MDKLISFAQKGLILDKTKTKLLTIKYGNAKFTPEVLNKHVLPGGKLDFGEEPDTSFIREVKEETGITITPGQPFHVYTWIYKKEGGLQQIVALARIGFYSHGVLFNKERVEKETSIESRQWIEIKELSKLEFTKEETPVIKKFLEYSKKNPFSLK
ncbi:hypothetical protein A2115_02695 [Candidatus Woesebacteria bacterium GWA1_41_8]|uniref:Nudix hydrolase domain-containing protein n=1 Tax=Candidatus Woesebacteria bacterium GWA1_41_8 TaxID=1802471 RepID=A0A1F7WKA6_9BACT|nr:MAG: hypothetical protein A2115_02695 [Candidatus Woesebacteria bacterium GWA1_41_8]